MVESTSHGKQPVMFTQHPMVKSNSLGRSVKGGKEGRGHKNHKLIQEHKEINKRSAIRGKIKVRVDRGRQ